MQVYRIDKCTWINRERRLKKEGKKLASKDLIEIQSTGNRILKKIDKTSENKNDFKK